ncbi:MAG: UPF0175 family protein [Saprospiraceae bacterium]|nr:UPF0175 family protein [Saprospiraceae bacterium]
MKALTLNLPDQIDLDNQQLSILVAVMLYEKGKLSLGQASEVAGLTKRAFAEMMGSYNVSIFNYPSEDLKTDVFNA